MRAAGTTNGLDLYRLHLHWFKTQVRVTSILAHKSLAQRGVTGLCWRQPMHPV